MNTLFKTSKLLVGLISKVNQVYKSLFTNSIKSSLSDSDYILIRDSSDSNIFKKTSISNFAKYNSLTYFYFTDGITKYRIGVRDSKFVLDKALTGTGFEGIENTDWENLETSE